MTIKYFTKNVYGRELIYFADAGQARLWYAISGRKTVEQSDMQRVTELTGTKFERVFGPEVA